MNLRKDELTQRGIPMPDILHKWADKSLKGEGIAWEMRWKFDNNWGLVLTTIWNDQGPYVSLTPLWWSPNQSPDILRGLPQVGLTALMDSREDILDQLELAVHRVLSIKDGDTEPWKVFAP